MNMAALATVFLSVGLIPVPDFNLTNEDLTVTIEAGLGEHGDFRYSYQLRNPEGNTGDLVFFRLQADVPRGHGWPLNRDDLYVHPPRGPMPYQDMVNPRNYTPIGTELPEYWVHSLHADAISFYPASGSGHAVVPGGTAGPFVVLSPSPPSLRYVEIEPRWVLRTEEYVDATPDQMREARKVEDMLRQELTTVGPFGVRPNSGIYLEKFLSDMKALPDLGWCDADFTESAHELVSTHKEGIQSADYDIREPLSEFIESLPAWEGVCSRQEAYLLIKFGLEAMLGQLPEDPPPAPPSPFTRAASR